MAMLQEGRTAAFGAMETLSEQPQRSASGTTDAIHILQAIFQETHFTTFPNGFVQLSRRAPISPAFTLDNRLHHDCLPPARRADGRSRRGRRGQGARSRNGGSGRAYPCRKRRSASRVSCSACRVTRAFVAR